jgi:hypothetical protein
MEMEAELVVLKTLKFYGLKDLQISYGIGVPKLIQVEMQLY